MLRPSTAPRWNTATITLRRPSAAAAARARKRGGAATAASAQAPALRSARRVSIGVISRRGGPRYGPPRPPSLGRAPAQPWRASGSTQDVSSRPPLGVLENLGQVQRAQR